MTTATFTRNPSNTFRQMFAKYDSGICASCARGIKAGEEILYRASDKKIHHNACPIEPVSLEEMGLNINEESVPSTETKVVDILLPDGYYTVVRDNNNHMTFRVRTQKPDADFAPGSQIISTLVGPDNTSSYKGWGFVNTTGIKVWKSREGKIGDWFEVATAALITGNYKEAGLAYATQSGNCYVCNRLLTDPTSIALGIGPICREK